MEDFVPASGIKMLGQWGGEVQYGGGDKTMVVMFYLRPVHNKPRSTEIGRPYFEDKIFVRIHPPGERLNIIEREANDADKKRFPMQWHQFQENRPQLTDGTPIAMLFPGSPSIAAALQASGVHTVEQCAELSAHAIESIGMGAQQWCNEATRYLQVANKGVKASELKAAMDASERENNSLKNKIALLEVELNKLRDHTQNTVSMADVERLIANQGGRALYPDGKRQLNPSFDAQTAQINATHVTHDLAKGTAKKSTSAKRARVR